MLLTLYQRLWLLLPRLMLTGLRGKTRPRAQLGQEPQLRVIHTSSGLRPDIPVWLGMAEAEGDIYCLELGEWITLPAVSMAQGQSWL